MIIPYKRKTITTDYKLALIHFLFCFQKNIVKKIIEKISKTKNYEEFAEYFNAQWSKYLKKIIY